MRFSSAIFLLMIAMGAFLLSCSRDIDVDLPANEPALVVECYLEDGQAMRALVTESTALLDTNVVPPVIMDAVVTITYAGHTDTLQPYIYIDSARNRVYNYGSNAVVHANYTSGELYRIDVTDAKGRHASGIASFLPPVPIISMEYMFGSDSVASLLTTFPDDRAVKDYYRMVIKRNAHYDSIQTNRLLTDDLANNSGDIIVRSGFHYTPGDSIHATLYHLSHDYYQYINTSQNARSALGNPFAASGEVVTNIQGGLGVFAALSITHKSILIP